LFRPSALAVLASLTLALASGELHAQAAKKAPFAAEGDHRSTSTPAAKSGDKRGWAPTPLTCNAQPTCTSSPSARCIAVSHSYKDGTDKGRALDDIVRRCERANRQDSVCGCITQCRQAARCS
jgi:hypothetical protein